MTEQLAWHTRVCPILFWRTSVNVLAWLLFDWLKIFQAGNGRLAVNIIFKSRLSIIIRLLYCRCFYLFIQHIVYFYNFVFKRFLLNYLRFNVLEMKNLFLIPLNYVQTIKNKYKYKTSSLRTQWGGVTPYGLIITPPSTRNHFRRRTRGSQNALSPLWDPTFFILPPSFLPSFQPNSIFPPRLSICRQLNLLSNFEDVYTREVYNPFEIAV